MTIPRRTLAAVATASVGLLVVSACSGSSKKTTTTASSGGSGATSSSTTTGSTTTGSTSAPNVSVSGQVGAPPAQAGATVNDMAATPRSGVKTGGKFVWGTSQTVANFNYNEVDGPQVDAFYIDSAILPSPFHFDAKALPTVNTDYFTSITKKSSTPLVIDYKINPKAKWSDGKPISWTDIQAQAAALTGKAKGYNIAGSQGYDQIGSVKKGANDLEAVVTFATPFADWQSLFSPLYPASLNSSAKAFNTGWAAQPLVSAGPFKFGSQDKGAQSYTVVRDPKWWGQPAKLDSIVFKAYNDPAAAVQAIGSHQVDYYDVSGGSAFQNVQALKKYKGVSIRQAGGVNYRQFTLNTKDAMLSDEKVRQAVFLGIDRNRITKLLIGNLGGNPTSLDNHIFLKNQAPYTSNCGDLCTYNPTKAKQLLTEDGWTMSGGYFTKGGQKLSLAITLPADTPNSVQEAETAQATLKAVGIELTLKSVPSNDFFAKYINVGKFQLTTFTWIGTQFPVGGSLAIYKYDPKNIGQNFGSGGNAAINALLAKSAQSLTSKDENDLANQADAQIWTNASWLPLYQRPQVWGINSQLVNLGAPGLADYRFDDMGFKV